MTEISKINVDTTKLTSKSAECVKNYVKSTEKLFNGFADTIGAVGSSIWDTTKAVGNGAIKVVDGTADVVSGAVGVAGAYLQAPFAALVRAMSKVDAIKKADPQKQDPESFAPTKWVPQDDLAAAEARICRLYSDSMKQDPEAFAPTKCDPKDIPFIE